MTTHHERAWGMRTPGWYPDPDAGHLARWWDGAAWSDEVRQVWQPRPGSTPTPQGAGGDRAAEAPGEEALEALWSGRGPERSGAESPQAATSDEDAAAGSSDGEAQAVLPAVGEVGPTSAWTARASGAARSRE